MRIQDRRVAAAAQLRGEELRGRGSVPSVEMGKPHPSPTGCFCCDKKGHSAAECLMPRPMLKTWTHLETIQFIVAPEMTDAGS